MAYVVETEVDRYGYLTGDISQPQLSGFTWTPGLSGRRPNVFHHNLLRDFVCDELTFDVLSEVTRGRLDVSGRGSLDGIPMVVVQVTAVFDVVDVARSLPAEHASAGSALRWPHIPPDREPAVEGSLFRVPNSGLSLMYFASDDVKAAVEARGITGFTFVSATVLEG